MAQFKYFSFCLLQIIDTGATECIETVAEHINDGTIVSYLTEKYADVFDKRDFANKHTVEEYFSNYKGDLETFADKKFGICGENSGLLLLLALIINA